MEIFAFWNCNPSFKIELLGKVNYWLSIFLVWERRDIPVTQRIVLSQRILFYKFKGYFSEISCHILFVTGASVTKW